MSFLSSSASAGAGASVEEAAASMGHVSSSEGSHAIDALGE